MEYILPLGRREDLPHAYDIRACGNDFRGPWIIQVGHVVSSPPAPVSFRSGVWNLHKTRKASFVVASRPLEYFKCQPRSLVIDSSIVEVEVIMFRP